MRVDEVNTFYKNNISDKVVEELIYKISLEFIKANFTENPITNEKYELIIFKDIQKRIIQELKTIFIFSDASYKEISNYIFKNKFKFIFENIADLLINELVSLNTNVLDFLKYYSLDIIIVDSKKYKVPKIQENDGPIWNLTSMISNLKPYVKARDTIQSFQNQLDALNNELSSYNVNSISPIEHNIIINKQYQILESSILENEKKIDILREALLILNDEIDVRNIQQELKHFVENRTSLRISKSELVIQKIKQTYIGKYESLLKEIEKIHRTTKLERSIVQKNRAYYLSIKHSLIKALISKKQAL